MTNSLALYSWVLAAASVWSLPAASAEPPRLPRDNLLLYRGDDGKPREVQSVEDWRKRRAEIVRGVEAVMGKLSGKEKRCPLDVKVEEEVDGGTYVRRLITYASEPGSRVPAYLLIPKEALQGGKKVPAVLCLHGTDNVVGHGTVVGLGKNPNRKYAVELAELGYVTLAPNYPLLAKYQPDVKKLGWESGTLKAVWDNIRGLDYLESLPFVDSGAVGAIGHSLGGHNSVYTAVFDERLKVVVSSCGLDSFLDYYGGNEKNWHPEKGWCQTRYMPKLADYRGRLADIPFDFHELIGALAPRHVLIIAPKEDHNFQAASVDRVAAAARPVFKLHGHPDRLRVEHPDGGHDFPPTMREEAYKLFDAVLRRADAPRLELVGGVKKIWDKGKHNAFTDLIRFKDRWYCTFREADGHVGGDGQLRVLSSADGEAWESAALLSEKGIDLRDPKLSVTPDGRLMIVAGGSVYEGKKLLGRQPRVAFSKDGKEWTPTKRVLGEGDWLWRVTWHGGKCYGVSYNAAERASKEAKEAAKTGPAPPGPADWKLKLVVSADGETFDLVTHLDVPGHPNETTLRFTPGGEMVALVRREGGNTRGWVGTSKPPYKDWAWKELPARIGGPNFVFRDGGPTIAAVRLYDKAVRTSLCLLDPAAGKLEEALKLPSGGDTSYAGLVWHDDVLWVSYYSSHEGKSAIYLAKVKVGK
jgi:dienelactone hydrolase